MKIIIVGDGKVGLTLTQMLSAEDHDITVVDQNPKVLQRMLEEYDVMAVRGHGASREVLEEAGAEEARLLIAATSSDEVNLLSCITAKKMGTSHTIARVRNPEYAGQLDFLQEELGLSFTINPEEACSREIFHLLQFPSFLGREQFAKGRVEIVKLHVDAASPLKNIQLTDLYDAAKVRVLVCAVDRDGDVTIPHGSFVIREEDDLYITASGQNLAALIKNLGCISHKVTQVTIVGGSRLGLYLARRLMHGGVGVKIIEKDPARCVILADLLPEADIVEGDGTEQELLLSEGADRADALVALTGMDEENIVLSMYARQLGIHKVITKCNRTQYSNMFRKMGVDTVVSPKLTVASQIVRYVRSMDNSTGGKMLTLHHIADGQVEAMEFSVDADARLLNTPLAVLPLKEGILIGAISRGNQTIIPTGNDIIMVGDTIVVLADNARRILDLDDIIKD